MEKKLPVREMNRNAIHKARDSVLAFWKESSFSFEEMTVACEALKLSHAASKEITVPKRVSEAVWGLVNATESLSDAERVFLMEDVKALMYRARDLAVLHARARPRPELG